MASPLRGLFKNIVLLFDFLVLATIFDLFNTSKETVKEISITQLVQDINNDKVKEIKVLNDDLTVTYYDGNVFQSKKETGESASQALINFGADKEKAGKVSFVFEEPSSVGEWLWPFLLLVVLPLLMFGVFSGF